MSDIITFEEFPKIARLKRGMVVTEKLDGTNACVIITQDGQIGAQSRGGLITPENDNYGFAKWVQTNREELLTLGQGHHFGEWWGSGIQKRYGGSGNPFPKTFSLFNTSRWSPGVAGNFENRTPPTCCAVVPVLYVGDFDTTVIDTVVDKLAQDGSVAAPGSKAEGVVIWLQAARIFMKKTIEKDAEWKGKAP